MSTEKRLIDYEQAKRAPYEEIFWSESEQAVVRHFLAKLPKVDAVEVDALKAWLYEIAMNNVDNYLCEACEEIISRLDGLRVFARERREGK